MIAPGLLFSMFSAVYISSLHQYHCDEHRYSHHRHQYRRPFRMSNLALSERLVMHSQSVLPLFIIIRKYFDSFRFALVYRRVLITMICSRDRSLDSVLRKNETELNESILHNTDGSHHPNGPDEIFKSKRSKIPEFYLSLLFDYSRKDGWYTLPYKLVKQ